MTDTELAWMAGFVDGEGYVGIARGRSPNGNHRYSLHVVVGQNFERPLVAFRNEFGGRIRFQNNRWGGAYQWEATANQAAACLKAVRPFLRIKHEQAEIGITFQARRGRRGGAPVAPHLDQHDYETLQVLKRRNPQTGFEVAPSPEHVQLALEAAA